MKISRPPENPDTRFSNPLGTMTKILDLLMLPVILLVIVGWLLGDLISGCPIGHMD